MQLLVANPGRKKRRKSRKHRKARITRRVRRAARKVRVIVMAKRARRRRRRGSSSSGGGGVKRFRRRSRRGFAALGALGAKTYTIKSAVINGVVGGVGAVGVNMLIDKIASMLPASLSSPTGRAATKAALGVGLGFAASRFGPTRRYAGALAAGGIVVACLDLYTSKMAAGGVKGLDYFSASGMQGLGQAQGQLVQTRDGSIYDHAGNLIWANPVSG